MRTYRWTLDLQMFSQEKTERATPKKRQEAEIKGRLRKVRSFQAHLFCCLGSLALSCSAVIIKNG